MSKTSSNDTSGPAPINAAEARQPMQNMNAGLQAWGPLGEYLTDSAQRAILFWDVLRQRSDQYYAQQATTVPYVLSF